MLVLAAALGVFPKIVGSLRDGPFGSGAALHPVVQLTRAAKAGEYRNMPGIARGAIQFHLIVTHHSFRQGFLFPPLHSMAAKVV